MTNKKRLYAVVFVVLAFVGSSVTIAETFDLGFGVTSKIRAFSISQWSSEEGQDRDWRRLRLRGDFQRGGKWGLRLEADFVQTDEVTSKNGNWAQVYAIFYQATPCSRIYAGRIFSNARQTDDAPLIHPTIHYARSVPFKAYAHGIKYYRECTGEDGKQRGVLFGFDVTGPGALVFDDDKSLDFDHDDLRTSFRLRIPHGQWYWSAAGQFGENLSRGSLKVEWYGKTDNVNFAGGMYYTDEVPTSQRLPGWAPVVFAEWRPTDKFRPYVEFEKPAEHWRSEFGVSFFPCKYGRITLGNHTARGDDASPSDRAWTLRAQLHLK